MVIECPYICTWMSTYTSNDQGTFLWQNDFKEARLNLFAFINHKVRGCPPAVDSVGVCSIK